MLHLTLRQLKVFESVARHLSYTRAAEEMFLSQPAVSMQIKQLEEQVGMPLFEQMGKKNYLTAAGKEMFHYARQVIRLLDEAEGVLQELKGLHRGTLDIAVASTANDFATQLLAAFAQQHENLRYRLDVTNRESLLAQLESNEKDLVIMGQPPAGMDLAVQPFMDNPLVIVAPPQHPLAQEAAIPLSRLTRETFVVREQGSGTRIAMARFFADRGVEIVSSMEMTSNEAIKQAVQAGLGLGLVSIHTVRLELEVGKLVVLDAQDFPIMRHWYVVHRAGKRLSPVAAAFKQFVLERAGEFDFVPQRWKKRG